MVKFIKNKFYRNGEIILKRKNLVLLCLSAAAVIFFMCSIFLFSSQDNVQTNTLSIKFTEKIAATVFSGYSAMSEDMKTAVVSEMNLYIRKTAHFSLYFFMSMVIYLFFAVLRRKYLFSGIISILICFMYASLDEFHQKFVPGRTPLVKDVMIDTSGAILGSILCFMIIASVIFISGRRKKNQL